MNLKNFSKDIDTRVRKFGNEYYLLAKGKVYLLNYLGAVVLKYINTDIDLEELANKINSVFMEQDIKMIEEDIKNFISFLLNEGIVCKIE